MFSLFICHDVQLFATSKSSNQKIANVLKCFFLCMRILCISHISTTCYTSIQLHQLLSPQCSACVFLGVLARSNLYAKQSTNSNIPFKSSSESNSQSAIIRLKMLTLLTLLRCLQYDYQITYGAKNKLFLQVKQIMNMLCHRDVFSAVVNDPVYLLSANVLLCNLRRSRTSYRPNFDFLEVHI